MSKRLDIQNGTVYGKLTVVSEAPSVRLPSGQINREFNCQCECGNTKVVKLLHLVRGRISSCGCLGGERHGQAGTLLYNTWRGIKNRCYSDSYHDKHLYKDKGIIMCDEWRNSFIVFRDWALSNGWREGLEIDRIDGNGNYEPSNCRCVTSEVNSNNLCTNIKVIYKGEEHGLMMLIKEKNLLPHLNAVRRRIDRGWTADKAIDTPIKQGNYKRKTVVN